MDKLILDLTKDGKDINEVLNMPFYYVIQLLEEKQRPEKKKSLISAFSG